MQRRSKFLTIATSVLLVPFLFVAMAMADTITSPMATGDTNLTAFGSPTPYATVTVSVPNGGGDATITFTALTQGGFSYLFGDSDIVALNMVAGASLAQAPTWIGGNGNTTLAYSGAGTVDGFGVFNFTLTGFDGFSSAVNQIQLVFTTNGGFANAASVLTPNASGWDFGGHIYVANPDCQGACVTGYAAGTLVPPESAPEPASAALLAFGLVGLFALDGWRRKRNRSG